MKSVKCVLTILLTGLFINSDVINSQEIKSFDKWMDYLDELASESENSERIEALYTDLSYLVEHPLDLNRATAADWRRLPFLSDLQIQSLLDYREKNGDWLSIYELKNVSGLDFSTVELLIPFVHVGEKMVDKPDFSFKNLLRYGNNELMIRYDRTFQQKKGYRQVPEEELKEYPNRRYLGEPFYHSLRYAYEYDDRLRFGLVAEKDAGEPFWNRYHKGYDYYSFHFLLNDLGCLRTLALGDYRVSFGQGLVISHDFTPGKGADVAGAERRNNGFRRHYSTNEQDFFRGGAATAQFGDWLVSLFYSRKRVDGAVEDGQFTSLKADGQHRLIRDWRKRHTIRSQSYGGNVRFQKEHYHIGLTLLGYDFGGLDFQPTYYPYNRYYFRGKWNVNSSVDYMWKNDFIQLYGETAISKNGALATINACRYSPFSYLSLLLLYRYYDRRYQALYANSFAQNSRVQNEHGVYFGTRWSPLAYWKLSFYVDLFRFPWLRYGVDLPSSGQEYLGRLDYVPNACWSFYVRYKLTRKEKNPKADDREREGIVPYRRQRLRLQAACVINNWVLKTGVEGTIYQEMFQRQNKGLSVSQSVGWQPDGLPLRLDGYAAWFSTDDYASRIYSYEKNMLYAFYMPSFYGQGVRLALTTRWDIWKGWSLFAKLGYVHYLDRDRSGSDLEEILGPDKTDLSVLLRWKF